MCGGGCRGDVAKLLADGAVGFGSCFGCFGQGRCEMECHCLPAVAESLRSCLWLLFQLSVAASSTAQRRRSGVAPAEGGSLLNTTTTFV